MELPVLIDTLRTALERDTVHLIRDQLEDVHPADYAAALTEFSIQDLWILLTALPRAEQAEVMARYFKGLDAGQAKALAFSKARQGPSPDLSAGYRYLKVERMACYVNKDVYRDTMRQTAAELA